MIEARAALHHSCKLLRQFWFTIKDVFYKKTSSQFLIKKKKKIKN